MYTEPSQVHGFKPNKQFTLFKRLKNEVLQKLINVEIETPKIYMSKSMLNEKKEIPVFKKALMVLIE